MFHYEYDYEPNWTTQIKVLLLVNLSFQRIRYESQYFRLIQCTLAFLFSKLIKNQFSVWDVFAIIQKKTLAGGLNGLEFSKCFSSCDDKVSPGFWPSSFQDHGT